MPTFYPKIDAMTSSSLDISKHPRGESQLEGIFQMKEFSLIRHVEALKYAAHAPILFPDVNNSGHPNIVGTPIAIAKKHEQSEIDNFGSRSQSSVWAIDPSSVPGNVRKSSETKGSSLTIEEILSRGSSVVGKNTEDGEESQPLPVDRSPNKTRRKRSKSSKRRIGNRKSLDTTPSPNAGTAAANPFSLVVKNNLSDPGGPAENPLDSLTALCKGVKIHEKVNTNSSNAKLTRKPPPAPSTHGPPPQAPLTAARTSLNNAITEYSKKVTRTQSQDRAQRKKSVKEDDIRLTKVYQSEKQSGFLSDCGMAIPCAPPGTPTPEMLRKYEFVPSMQDIRAQRSIRQRLQMMETRAQKKEKMKQEENIRAERLTLREKKIELKKKQRLEIYALNKVMTDLENQRFVQFMQSMGSNT